MCSQLVAAGVAAGFLISAAWAGAEETAGSEGASLGPLYAQADADAAPAPEAAAEDDDRVGIEQITVTARRREEVAQDIPLAITTLGADEMEATQLVDYQDLQFNVPNLAYTKTNFSGGGSLAIRGIGRSVIAASGENSTGVHVNGVSLVAARIFEAEFFDTERLEVLRGPQGTLYGRNSSAGAVNVITRRPTDEAGGYLEAEYGDFDHTKFKGALNLPLSERLAVRLAGFWLDREGYTDNLATGNDIDDRSIWGLRFSADFQASDRTSAKLTVSLFDEDDHRSRSHKQVCNTDTADGGNPALFFLNVGCRGTEDLGEGSINGLATLGGLLNAVVWWDPAVGDFWRADTQAGCPGAAAGLSCLGYFPTVFNGQQLRTNNFSQAVNPSSLRDLSSPLDPDYQTDELVASFELGHEFERFTLTSITGWADHEVSSLQDYFWTYDPTPLGWSAANGGRGPEFDFPGTGLGGHYTGDLAFDTSDQKSDLFSQEIRLASEFEGRVNFTAGAIYTRSRGETAYGVYAGALESFYRANNNLANATDAQLAPLTGALKGAGVLPDAAPDGIAGLAALGAACAPTLTAIGQSPALCAATGLLPFVGPYDPNLTYFLAETPDLELESYAGFGEVYFDLSDDTRVTVGGRLTNDKKSVRDRSGNLFSYGDPDNDGEFGEYERRSERWTKFTGRLGIDHQLRLAIGDALVYANVSTGFKSGGFNNSGEFTPPTFDEEEITSYEVGWKSLLFDNRLQLNLTGFFYDYEGYQISKIVNRTALNENADVEIRGFELESVFRPTRALQFDFSLSWLDSEIQDFRSVDPINMTAGRPGYTMFKDVFQPVPNGQNAVMLQSDLLPCLTGASLVACASYNPIGFESDLDGNELPQAPELTVKLGGQYTFELGERYQVTLRADWYWQDETWGRIYNLGRDEIDSWSQLDAQIVFQPVDAPWSLRVWGKNLADNDDITGMYLTDPTSALFTNLFILEPRVFGASVRYEFGSND
ncbi:MAG: TonB-dependent receptor plug domain-containing protein [Proteobacteria bacterium]|nr:TonB-dependent receptor plug domain-containing protein [Pseudomonadota bacterium]